MKLDFFTLFFTLGIIDLFIAAILIYYIASNKTVKWFIVAYLIHRIIDFLVLTAIALRNKIPDFISVDIANIFYFSNSVLLIISLSSYRGKLNKQYLALLLSIAFIIISFFLSVSDDTTKRVIVSSFGAFVLFGIGGTELIIHRKPFKMPVMVSIGFLSYSLLNVYRGIYVLINQENGYDPVLLNTTDLVLSYTIIFGILISTFGFLLLLREMDEKIIETNNRFIRIALDQSPIDILITDMSGKVIFANPSFVTQAGKTKEEILHHTAYIFDNKTIDNATTEKIWTQLKSDLSWQGELKVSNNNQKPRILNLVISPLKDIEGKISYFIVFQIDITQNLADKDIIKDQNQLLNKHIQNQDRFISILAHDLRSPISGFYQLTNLIRNNVSTYDAATLKQYLEVLSKNSYNIFQLLENLLLWAKSLQNDIEFQRKELILADLVKQTMRTIAENINFKNLELINLVDSNLRISAHPDMLKTVIRNLVVNASKYTPAEGKITIDAKENNMLVTITVTDTGVGMDQHTIAQLFRLEETKSVKGTDGEQGTGFGLVICKDFITKHGGEIWVESEIDKGSKFSFTIPKILT